MKIIFAGTPDFAANALQAIVTAGFEVVLVLTQPDRPKGRGLKLQASAVKELAVKLGLPVAQPICLNDEETVTRLKQTKADMMVVAAYGLLLSQKILDIPKQSCLNIHASLLPRWRGAAPIQRAIEAGDSQTGVGIMQMKLGLDTGDVLYELKTPILANDTASSLQERLAQLGGQAIVTALTELNRLKPRVQDEAQASYAHKLTKENARIDWSEGAMVIERKIRAFNPFPCAWTTLDGQPFKIWQAGLSLKNNDCPAGVITFRDKAVLVGTGAGTIVLQEVQIAGGKRLPIHDFLQGHPLLCGQKLGV